MDRYLKLLITLFFTFFLGFAFTSNISSASKTENASSIVQELIEKVQNIQETKYTEEEKRTEFLQVIQTFFDMNIIAKASTGPYWRTATSNEKKRYTELITELIADITASQLGDISNVEFQHHSSIQKGDKMVMVSGELIVPNQSKSKINVNWRFSTPDSDVPKIIDVEFENISMLVAQKEENVAIIRKNGGVFSALITAIEEKLRK
jgi:phospholipid transport system substrate-binding protein